MKILGISASPRRGGNSEILLDKALKGASSMGAYAE
jgi:multimeric flavodoxin WrbA